MEYEFESTVNMNKYIKALEELGEPVNTAVLGQIIAYNVKKKVPTDTGKLRAAYDVENSRDTVTVTWGGSSKLPYSHYQFVGRVYGPNKAVFTGKQHTGWVSPVKPKTPKPRMMGTPVDIDLKDGRVIHIKGYSKAGTGSGWIKLAREDSETYNPIQYQSGRYLYEKYCSVLNTTPVGGYKVLNWAEKLTNDS